MGFVASVAYTKLVAETDFKNPDTARMLRLGIASGLVGLVVIVLVTLAVGRSAIDGAAIEKIIARTTLWPMLLSMAIMSTAFVFLGHRWRALLISEPRPPGLGLAAILCAGLLLNSALPGPVGEFGAAWFAHRRYRVSLGLSLAAGMGARIIGMVVAASAAAVCFGLARPPVPETYRHAIDLTAALVALLAIGLTAVVWRPEWMVAVSSKTIAKVRLTRRLDETVHEAAAGLISLRTQGPWAYIRCILWSIGAHGSVYLGILIAAWSLGSEPSLSGLLFTYATTTAAVVVMFALPGSQVGWDAIFLTLLTTTAGLALPDALAVAVVVRVQQLVIMAIGAGALTWLARTAAEDGE